MSEPKPAGALKKWLLQGYSAEPEGPYETETEAHTRHHERSWWQVMCLTGVDYFSTLGYQPGIAALAAGALSPIATLMLVVLTLFGALPMYRRVAEASPHGDGSISMLASLLSYWKGKGLVLSLIGFAATGFIITITLSAADAAAHVVENPLVRHTFEGAPAFWQIAITMVLLVLLGAVFLKGFNEAIGIAVGLVGLYIGLNLIVIGDGIVEIIHHPAALGAWKTALFSQHSNPAAMILASVLVFPKLALGLSGFETGVVVMPLIKGDPGDDPEKPKGRIRNAGTLLTTAALIMSVLLVGSSVVTTMLIPHDLFKEGGPANGRALAYMAHKMGEAFGTTYDIATVLILWFAGASAMAGLLNIVPRYLPRYGMAPEWTRANRPLVLIFTGISMFVTLIFKADVNAQAGAYATGVLALMTSATVAVTIAAYRKKERGPLFGFGLVTLIFIYTTLVNIQSHPEGLKIALFFVGVILVVSMISRVWRTTELRVDKVQLDDNAMRMLREMSKQPEVRFIANHPDERDAQEYSVATFQAEKDHQIPPAERYAFLEVYVQDASAFSSTLTVEGHDIGGFWVLRCYGVAVPNAIAATLIHVQKTFNRRPHVYFNWIEGSPLAYLGKFFLSGQGDVAPLTHEILRRVEPDPGKRPIVHAAG